MKVCKFDKIEDEDKINRIIKYIINENPYVIAIPPLLPLEEKAREISIGWFREDNETYGRPSNPSNIIVMHE